MVGIDTFKKAFANPVQQPVAPAQPQYYQAPVQQVPVQSPAPAPLPVAQPQPYVQEDPNIAKLKFFMLKWLSIIVGGGALLLIVWRVALKFF